MTKDSIKERMAVATHEAWSVPGTAVQPPLPADSKPVMTKEIMSGRINVDDANEKMVEEFSKKHGLQKPN